MEDDNLFSNFSRQNPEQSTKKEKSFIGKKRNGEQIKSQNSGAKKLPLEKDASQSGQKLENIINEKIGEENNEIKENEDEDIIVTNEVEFLKKEKEHLKNQILKVFPDIDEEIKTLKNIPKVLNDNKDNKKINNIKNNSIQDNKINNP